MARTNRLVAVVNHDLKYLDLVNEVLTEQGYRTIGLAIEDTAYDLIKRDLPELVILDIRLEHPDAGLIVLDLMKIDPRTEKIPVIVCSVATQWLRDMEKQLREYNCEILEKPFTREMLMAKVSAVLDSPRSYSNPT